ncbi:efflux RND transporter permease subunit [Flavobacterium sp. LC2016-01]|uniref:efflux RND transporter permease subunit n=1 Tax=Flavobacterium sp. LC2016-01 TaxID=2675876 RepID=UPI0012BA8216|nr:efflux RND transporter permease subunit [Flavobacterium sp. LC2016-01]MTH15831.1 MMPL family transporter [Flavobacterium sp. LC2016-01]
MKITNYAVKNYQFTLIMFAMVAAVGLATLFTMPRAEDPALHPPSYVVTVIYPGTSPKEMEETVVKPLEKKIYQLENIAKIMTTIKNGLAVLVIDFKYGVDVENKYQELSTEINALKGNEIPKDIYSLKVEKINSSDVNVLQIALVSQNASAKAVRDYADELKTRLEKITELKNVEYSGVPEQEIHVDLQFDKLARLKIPISAVIGSMQSEGTDISGGNLNMGAKSFNVKTSGKYKDAEDVANTVIYNTAGQITYLKDVAEISRKNEVEKHYVRLNGVRAVLVNAAMKENLNIASVEKKYLPVIEQFEKTLPANIKLIKNFDQGKMVSNRLNKLGEDFAIAILLVLITLLPLGTRASIIVMITIPISLALGLVILNAFGYSLNQLSIVGLVVALGLLVDDSIVVVENIERWLREGYSKNDAVLKGTAQIGEAVLGCTATLIIAFLPLAFLPDKAGEFVRSLPVAIMSSVFASMIVALTLVPFLASRILLKPKNDHGNMFLRNLQKFINFYGGIMTHALHKPLLTLFIALALSGSAIALFPAVGFKLFPASEKAMFLVNLNMPLQTNLTESDKITKQVEAVLKKYPEIKYFTSNVGKGNPQVYYNIRQQKEQSDFAQILVQMDNEARPSEKIELIEKLRKRLADFPYAKVEVKDFEQGPPIEAPISIRIFGENMDSIRAISFKVEKILRADKGTVYVNNELNVYNTDVRVNINRDKARTLGIQTGDIDKTVRLAVAGLEVAQYIDEKGDSRKVVVSAPLQKFATLDAFHNMFVNTSSGKPVALNQIAEVKFETSPTAINHFNKSRYAKVNAYTKEGILANNVLKEVVPKIDAIKMPEGYYYKLSGEKESEGDSLGGNFITVIIMSIFLFVAALILQFKNFKGIIIVLSVIPLGIVGGIVLLFLSGNHMGLVTIIGFIGLSGIEVKNSLLLVDFTNQLRREGMPLEEAIVHAGETRFLPVVLTSLTAIFGLIPIALNPNPNISPLAIVLIGGLISSTLLSRILTPVMYKLIPPRIEVNQDVQQPN